jgi:hypothetical protein
MHNESKEPGGRAGLVLQDDVENVGHKCYSLGTGVKIGMKAEAGGSGRLAFGGSLKGGTKDVRSDREKGGVPHGWERARLIL